MAFEIVIIGCGFAGIGAAIKLKESGINDFIILEKDSEVGGTWRDNCYPGIACDLPVFTYCYSFEQNPNWSRVFAPGKELFEYTLHCVEKYRLRPHIRVKSKVERAVFDTETHLWNLTLVANTSPITCRFIISSTGILTQPKNPDIPGLSSFTGTTIHTAQWRDDVDLKDKRVAVIGTGASAVQLIPKIAKNSKCNSLDVYQRTPIWVVPKINPRIPEWLKFLFRWFPPSLWLVRYIAIFITELVFVISIINYTKFPFLIASVEKLGLRHLQRMVKDPETRAKLLPNYRFGCKRPTISNSYYKSFNNENVSLITDRIQRITPRGIVVAKTNNNDKTTTTTTTTTTTEVERPVDVLVLATGFQVIESGNLPTFKVIGVDGKELNEYWENTRYHAYEGVSIPSFPNYFLIFGPFSFTGASWFTIIESHLVHIMRCIKAAREKNATYCEVKEEVSEQFLVEMKERMKGSVFVAAKESCGLSHSYYFDKHGDASLIRPTSGFELYWNSYTFPIDNYKFKQLPAQVMSTSRIELSGGKL